ncbi:MAG: hypothetical protein K8T89_21495 [Planctomycetes bacterium]|nr:hypothetical protein [Planctomycetota bacterium]
MTTITHCPKCKEELGRIEALDGRCLSCGATFDRAASASHGEPEDSPYHPSPTNREPLTSNQKWSIVMLIAFLATLVTPFGLIYSCYIGVQKGGSLCAHMGCTDDATKKIEYGRGIKRGYCDAHAKSAAESVTKKEMQFPIFLCIGAFLFLGFYLSAFNDAYMGKVKQPADPEKKPKDPFRQFTTLTIASIVGVNGLFWLAARYLC